MAELVCEMPCYHPLEAWQETKGAKPKFKKPEHHWHYQELKLPCGQCVGCRLDRSRQWAVRCIHEAQYHEQNSFITLTYNNENLPYNGSLVKSDFQKFMKRLRKAIYPKKIKFYQCGEYGCVRDSTGTPVKGLLGRPHYHSIIFGHQFEDLEVYKTTNKITIYKSDTLEQIWGKGFCTVGEVTYDSAAYVARYVLKKQNGQTAESHYKKIDQYGEEHEVQPEYTTMSRGGQQGRGIGYTWFQDYKATDLHKDYLTLPGKGTFKPPKYYDNLFKMDDPERFHNLQDKRMAKAKQSLDNTPDRLKAREAVKKAQAKQLIRDEL